MPQKPNFIFEFSVFVILIGLAILSRFWLADVPNFKPIASIALLSGFFFRRLYLAVALPLLAMLISDWQIGAYDANVMYAVYAGMALCPLIGWATARFVDKRETKRSKQALMIFSGAIAMSISFYLITNLAVWMTWYGGSWTTLLPCYVSALPFLKYTLLGNVCFSMSGLVACWLLSDCVQSWVAKRSAADVSAQVDQVAG